MPLSKKEKLFCCLYSELGNITEAAQRAGFNSESAFEQGAQILSKRSAQYLIKRTRDFLRVKEQNEISAALRRMIFTQANDAVRLVMSEDEALSLERMDFFGVSELKKVKGGGVEVKMINRLDAVRLLYEIERDYTAEKKTAGLLLSLKEADCPDLAEKEDDFTG